MKCSAWLNVTDCCNNKCVWCYAQDVLSYHLMPFDQAKEIIDWLKEMDCISCVLIGGEPTLHPQLPSIFKYGLDQGIEMRLVTNGRAFSSVSFCRDMINGGLKTGLLTFSMHASNRQNSASLTGDYRYFVEFEEGFQNLINENVIPDINITLSRYSYEHVSEMLRWVGQTGIKKVVFNTGIASVSRKKVNTDFVLSPSEMCESIIHIRAMTKEHGMRAIFQYRLPLCVMPRRVVEELIADEALITGCHLQVGASILFNVSGDMVPCNHLLEHSVFPYSAMKQMAKEGNLRTIWKTRGVEALREATYVFRSEKCADCDLWEVCLGGCPIFWRYNDPSVINGWKL